MTAAHCWELRCDSAGCPARYTSALARADATRAAAAACGWAHGVVPPTFGPAGAVGSGSRSLDYCPDHAGELGELCPKTLPAHARVADSA